MAVWRALGKAGLRDSVTPVTAPKLRQGRDPVRTRGLSRHRARARPDGTCTLHLRGVEIFDPTAGEVRSLQKVEDDIACWFVNTDYDGESWFVRQADFLGGQDPDEKRQSALKAETDPDAWASAYSTISRPLAAPKSGRIPAEVVNHYGDEALHVFPIPAPPSRRASLIPPPARLFTLVSLCFT